MMSKLKNKLTSPETAITLLQAMTVLAALVVLKWTAILGVMGVKTVGSGIPGIPGASFAVLAVTGFAVLTLVSVSGLAALWTFFRLCGRMKQATAFTHENQRAMGRIALYCLIAGGALLVGAGTLWIAEQAWGHIAGLYMLEMTLLGAVLLAVAAIAWTLCLLVRRAVLLQEEADLTV